jgi:hypothetical protein
MVMRTRKTLVHHWRFQTGEPEEVGKSAIYPTGYRDGAPRGWYCWVYPADDREFEEWMSKNCPTTDFTHRFNSGDPMYTVYIKEEKEALIFQLRWLS